jgi:hypothetical protein
MQKLIKRTLRKDYIIICLLFCTGILSRLFFLEKMQSHWDGPQYSIGVVRYSLEQQTPAPLGYPLYIAMGRLFYELIHDPHLALLVISVLFSGIGAVVFYNAGKILANRTVGIIASILYLSGPTLYYFGLTAYAYGLVPVIATALAISTYLIAVKKIKKGFIIGVIYSLALGIRPQEFFAFTPLFLLGLYYLPGIGRVQALASFVLVTLCWLLPFMMVVGGIEKYIQISKAFFAEGALSPFSFTNVVEHAQRIAKGYFLTFTAAGAFVMYYPLSWVQKKTTFKKILANRRLLVFLFCFIPSFLSNLFIRSDHAGYQMIYLASLIVPISYAIWIVCRKNKQVVTGVVMLLVLANLWWFFQDRDPNMTRPYVPTSFHYSEIRKNDIRLRAKVSYIRDHFSSNNTVLITESQAWRPIMYYLPTYLTYNLEGLFTANEQFKDVVNISKNWNFRKIENNTHVFVVPEDIERIVFTDSGMSDTIRMPKKIITVSGNADMTVISVLAGEKYIYSKGNFIKKI